MGIKLNAQATNKSLHSRTCTKSHFRPREREGGWSCPRVSGLGPGPPGPAARQALAGDHTMPQADAATQAACQWWDGGCGRV
jgi:hypothetical protein